MKKGWETTSLGSVCRFVRGPFGGSLKKSVFVEDGFAVYEQQHAIYDQFEEIRYFIDEAKFNEMQRFEIQPRDLIMSCSGTMGKVAIVPEGVRRGIINQALLKLTPSNNVSPEFVKFWMDSEDFQESLREQSGGAAIQNVASVSVLKEIKMPLPALAEQMRIVGVLDEALAGLATAQAHAAQNLQNARTLFESHLQSVFTHRGKGWVEKRLGDLIEIQNGYAFKSDDYTDSGYFVIRIGNVQDGEITFDNPRFIKLADKKLERFILNAGDILVSLTGNIGRVGVIQDNHLPAVLNQRVARVTPKSAEADRDFVFRFLCSRTFREELQEAGHGAAQQNVSTKEMESVAISLPDLKEQRLIATQLDALAAETQRLTRLYEQKQAALAALKKSLLHRAFTGQL